MAKRLPPLSGLRTFVVAAKTCSFADAAEELFVTPAAVSRSIRSLEEYLGCTLFHRMHREVVLTREGETYYKSLDEVFERIAIATNQLTAERAKRPLVVCGFPSFMTRWLIPRLSHLRGKESAFDIRLITTLSHDIEFERNNVDVAIFTDNPVYPECTSEELFTTDLTPVCMPGFLDSGIDVTDTSAWKAKLIHSDTRPNDWARWAEGNIAGDFDPYAGQHFESSNLMYEAAISGLGIGIGLTDTLSREFATKALVEAFPDAEPAKCPIYLIRPQATEQHPHFRHFREWIVNEARTLHH